MRLVPSYMARICQGCMSIIGLCFCLKGDVVDPRENCVGQELGKAPASLAQP